MKEKDTTEKLLQDYSDVFADIVNVLLFHGEQQVDPEALLPAATLSSYHTAEELRAQDRDVAKYWHDQEIKIALIGFENQTAIEGNIPLRVIGYDGASYCDQLNKISDARRENRHRKKKAKESGEPAPELVPVPKVYPVITLVLYFGNKPWDQPLSLHGCMNIPNDLDEYVSDYKINLCQIAFLTDEEVELFQSDFKIIADYFVRTRKGEKDLRESSIAAMQTIRHLKETMELLAALTNDKRYEEIYNSRQKEGTEDTTTMCEVLDYYSRIGVEQGIQQEQVNRIHDMLLRGKTPEQIHDFCGYSLDLIHNVATGKSLSD